MYSRNAVIALTFAALAAPSAFAVPVSRESALLARQESGALNFQDVKTFGNDVLDHIQKLTPAISAGFEIWNKLHPKRQAELLEIMARAADDESGALSWQDVKDFGHGFVDGFTKTANVLLPIASKFFRREELERDLHLIARNVIEARDVDESGALNFDDVKQFAKDFGHGFVQGFTKTASALLPIAGAFIKREDMDIVARELANQVAASAVADAESGALNFQDVKDFAKDFGHGFVQGFTKTASALLPIAGAFIKREDMPLFQRQLEESGAFGWQDVADLGNGFLNGVKEMTPAITGIIDLWNKASPKKREEIVQILARGDVESGAFGWSDVADLGKGFLHGVQEMTPAITGIIDLYHKASAAGAKREDLLDILARAEIDESGALSFQDIKDFTNKVVNSDGFKFVSKAASVIAPIAAKFLKREDIDVLARELDAGRLSHADVLSILSRATDESGAINFDDVKQFAKDFGHGFVDGFTGVMKAGLPIVGAFLKREDVEMLARELTSSNMKREDIVDLLSRTTIDESGALSFQDVKDFTNKVVNSDAFKIASKAASVIAPIAASFLKREDAEMLARELTSGNMKREELIDLLSRATIDESGALNFDDVKQFAKDFGHGFVQGFTGVMKAGLPIVGALLKREDLARSLNELD